MALPCFVTEREVHLPIIGNNPFRLEIDDLHTRESAGNVRLSAPSLAGPAQHKAPPATGLRIWTIQ